MKRTRGISGFKLKKWSKLPRFSFVGASMRAFVVPRDTDALSVYHIALASRGSIAPAYHKKAVELIWVIKGSGIAQLGRRSIRIRSGDSLIIQPPTPHGFVAGRAGMTFLAALSPRVDSRTDYYSCSGHQHPHPRSFSGRPATGGVR